MKYILLTLLSLSPLMAKTSTENVEIMAQLNRFEKIELLRDEINRREKIIDEINEEASELFSCLGYGYDNEQKHLIWLEINRLEQYIAHALDTNTDIEKAINEPLCPTLTVHRNELDRMQHIAVRVCMEYFLLKKLYKLYNNIVSETTKIQ